MNPQQKKSCEFIAANVWVRIIAGVTDYTIYRLSAPRVHRNRKRPVAVLIWHHEKDTISLHKESETPQIIHSVNLREQVALADVTDLLYESHAICALEVVHVDHSAKPKWEQHGMWNLRLQDALRFIVHCIARDIPVERTTVEGKTEAHKTTSVFSAFPMCLTKSKQDDSKGCKFLSFCTRYNGYCATTFVHSTGDSGKWLSVDEETIKSRDAAYSILDVYNGIKLSDDKSQMLRIFTKQMNGIIDHKYAKTENMKDLFADIPGDIFTKVCADNPFCRVDESPSNHNRLTMCLASKPSDNYIQMRLTLHRFVKASISRSLNSCIETVLLGQV